MNVVNLGESRFPSPVRGWVDEQSRIPERIATTPGAELAGAFEEESADASAGPLLFEIAGPRAKLFFDPRRVRAGIVTCGGLCPGLNNVIRSLFLELHHAYGVPEVLGFRFGYQGMDPARGPEPWVLTPERVDCIHRQGGSILGVSRGPVDVAVAVDHLLRREVNVLFTIGGDGTQRGAMALYHEARRRGSPLAVVGIPKTIDNDVAFVERSFGYMTAAAEASRVIDSAHTEARSVQRGVALVKLMGRHAGFVSAGASVANQDVNFTLVPEIPVRLDGERGFLAALERRLAARDHAVIVVAEGAGQDLLADAHAERDASGNVKLKDIGLHLRERIEEHFRAAGKPVVMRYFDPSYLIRSRPADAVDGVLCDRFARNAVHAALAGKTGVVIGWLHDKFIHVPIDLLAGRTKRLDLDGSLWHAVLAATGQPGRWE